MMDDRINKIICGDVLNVLKTFPDEYVDCIITSPPYFGLRDYGDETKTIWGDENCQHEWKEELTKRPNASGGKTDWAKKKLHLRRKGKENFQEFVDYHDRSIKSDLCRKCEAWYGQLGLEPTLKMYLEHMLEITQELKRVLKKTGTMWWNHGDNYASLGKIGGNIDMDKGMDINRGRSRIKQGDYLEKSLLLQNFRLVQRMIDEQQWILRNVVIWYKPNVMPSSIKDRFTVDFEPVFFLTKSKRYWFETQYEQTGREASFEEYKKAKENTWPSGGLEKGAGAMKSKNAPSLTHPLGRNKRTVWRIPTFPQPEAHFATFPPSLVETPIKAGCPEMICEKCGKAMNKIFKTEMVTFKEYTDCGCNAGRRPGIVLDPFVGSGTTAYVARQLGRNYLGIELNPVYVKLAEDRLRQQKLL